MIFFKNKKKALILWYPIDLNLGDFYIFDTVKSYLLDWGYQIESADVGLPWKVLAKKARKCDLLWFAGGGIIERGVPDIIRNFSLFHKASKFIKFGVTGLSIGEFNYDIYKDSFAYWVNESDFFYSRDEFTANVFNSYANIKKVISSVDVVFAYDKWNVIPSDNNYVGVNFRDLPYIDLSGEFDWDKWCKTLKSSVSIDLCGIPDQFDCSKYVDFKVEKSYTPENAVQVLINSHFNIAMRYHVMLIGAMFGVPCIPICYCPKVSRLAEQLGLTKLSLDVHDYEKVAEKIGFLQNNFESTRKDMILNSENMVRIAKKMFEDIYLILNK